MAERPRAAFATSVTELPENGQEMVDLATSTRRRLGSRVRGTLDSIEVSEDKETVKMTGWAADFERGRLVDEVVVFVDDKSIFAGPTTVNHRQVSKRFEDGGLQQFGFKILLPRPVLSGASVIRVLAVSGRLAGELRYRPKAREYLPQHLGKDALD